VKLDVRIRAGSNHKCFETKALRSHASRNPTMEANTTVLHDPISSGAANQGVSQCGPREIQANDELTLFFLAVTPHVNGRPHSVDRLHVVKEKPNQL